MTPAPKIAATTNTAPATIATNAAIRFSRLVLFNHPHRDRGSIARGSTVVGSVDGSVVSSAVGSFGPSGVSVMPASLPGESLVLAMCR